MKKLSVLLLGALISVSAMADKIGVVNTNLVLSKFSGTKAVEASINASLEKLEKEVTTKADTLQKQNAATIQKGNNASDAEIKAFIKAQEDFQKYAMEKDRKFQEEKNAKLIALHNKVIAAVQEVASAEKYDYVYEQGALIYGGEDITNKVLQKLEASK